MQESFRGEYYQRVDSKARMLIPAPFRRILEKGDERSADNPRTRIVIVYGGGRARSFCEIYTMERAELLAAKVRRMKPGSDERKKAELHLLKRSVPVDIDEDGRIVVPPQVREKLGIEADAMKEGAEAVLAGVGNRLELWRSDLYREAHPLVSEDEEEDQADPLSYLPDDDQEF